MSTKRTVAIAILLGLVCSASGRLEGAEAPLALKSPPKLSPATLVAGKDANVTLEVVAAKDGAKQVQIQVRLGTSVLGAFNGGSLSPGATGKFDFKIQVPAEALGNVTLAIWGQGALIGSVSARIVAPAGPVVAGAAGDTKIASGPLSGAVAVELRANAVKSLTLEPNVFAGSSTQGTVTLESPARIMGQNVSLTSSGPSLGVPASVQVPAGATTAPFTAMAPAGAQPGSVTVSAVLPGAGGVSKQAAIAVWGVEQVRSLVKGSGQCPEPLRDGGSGRGPDRNLRPGDRCRLVVALETQAGAAGARAKLTSSSPSVTLPASVPFGPFGRVAEFELAIAPGAAAGPVTITAVGDRPGGIPQQIILAVDAVPASQVAGLLLASVLEPGLTYQGKVLLDSPAEAGGVVTALTSSNPAVSVPSAVTVPAGALNAPFEARVAAAGPAGNVTFSCARSGAGNPVSTTGRSVRFVQVSTVRLDTEAVGAAVVWLGLPGQGTVTLDGQSIAEVTVNLSSSSGDVLVPSSLTFPAGQTTRSFTATPASGARAGSVTLTAVRSSPGSTPKDKAVSLRVIQVRSLSFSPAELTWRPKPGDTEHSEGPLTSTGRVTLDAPAPAGGITVNLSCNEGLTGVSVPASLVVPAGQSSATFTATLGTQRKVGGKSGNRSSAPVTAVRSGQPTSEAKTTGLSIVWM